MMINNQAVQVRQSIRHIECVSIREANDMLATRPDKWVVIAFQHRKNSDWEAFMGEIPQSEEDQCM